MRDDGSPSSATGLPASGGIYGARPLPSAPWQETQLPRKSVAPGCSCLPPSSSLRGRVVIVEGRLLRGHNGSTPPSAARCRRGCCNHAPVAHVGDLGLFAWDAIIARHDVVEAEELDIRVDPKRTRAPSGQVSGR